jgi:transposase
MIAIGRDTWFAFHRTSPQCSRPRDRDAPGAARPHGGSRRRQDRPSPRSPGGSFRYQALLAGLREHSRVLSEAIGLAEEFTALVRGREPKRLDPWLQRAQNGAIPSLQRFAKRLSTDYDAVRAAVTLDWSNGPVEGQICSSAASSQRYDPQNLPRAIERAG